ncbi:fam-m protein [Plasmodium malariae]|uniref:Fam-m protein n=1 Tax=Plasmodium malariae TaxID=5858 RepID=A0A1D3JHA5_PLAMA|nr:fam-m protein [Plasmodium malariae]SBT85610.1 fam-m protein [Plasmodium malariae]
MEHKIKSTMFIKISVLIILNLIYHFNMDERVFNRSMDERYELDRRLDTKNYRILAKCIENNDSYTLGLKKDLPKNAEYEKKDISKNEKLDEKTNKQLNRSLLNKAQYYTEVTDYNKGMFDGKHFHFEKKWVKKKDYDHYLERNRRICDISLKKIKFRKYGIGISMLLIFLLLGIGIPVLPKLESLKNAWDSIIEGTTWNTFKQFIDSLIKGKEYYIFIALFSVLMIMLSIMIIISTYKILRNNEKYNKIKLINE